ncbi:microtubule-associated protein 4 isoform X2 [Alligator mississippiensis]|uniref:microtubule-associated protein 4 isoform X2 n=1 Tax=Alligator mississippiensis TaxID=8496 RepID=UPI0028773A8C|nr:microtubule-associated protein 4 isoform X2 [Alligator mississippiensis]
MADLDNNLSLADALTEPPPEIEPEIKRDFIATLEAEKFDDVVGETVGKTDYVPLLDDDDDDDAKAGSQDQKSKSHTEGVQVQRSSASGPAAVLENGDHGIGDYNTVSHEEIMDEKLSHKEFMDHKETWAVDERDLCFDPQAVLKPMEATEPGLMYREVDLSDLIIPSETKTFPPLAEHVDASEEVHAPYAAMVGSEQPSSEAPYFAAEALDSSVFSMDSAAEYLQERAAPARDRVPEEPWFGSQYAEETLDASFFVQPTVPIRIPDAAEQCLPESSIADAPFLVAEPTKETKTTAAPQEAAPADLAANTGSVPAPPALAFAADSWAAPAVDAGTAPAMDPWRVGSAPAAGLWSLPAANAASAPTMDSWAGPAADPWVTPAVPVTAADAGSSPAACVPTTEAGAVSAMEELLTFDHSIEQQGPALHMPPAGSSAPFVIREQEVPVPEVSVPEAEHAPVLAKLEDKAPSPNQHLPEPVTCVPEPAAEAKEPVTIAEAKEPVTIAEAKEPVTIAEAKETLPEKSAPLGDFTPVEKPKEEPENGHVQHLEPVHDKPPQEPTGVPTAQVRQASKSSERRFGRTVPFADVPEELLVGLPHQKSADPFSVAECGYVTGTPPRTRTPHKKAAGQLSGVPSEFVDSQRDVQRESWDSEGSPVIIKKKKKKPKQKRSQQPRTAEPGEENVETSKCLKAPPLALELQKPEAFFPLPPEEHSTVSREWQRTGASDMARNTKTESKSHFLDSPDVVSGSAAGQQEGPLKLLPHAKTGEVVKAEEMKDDSLMLQSKGRRKRVPMEQPGYKTEQTKMGEPSSAPTQLKPLERSPVDKNEKMEYKELGYSDLKAPLSESISLNKVESPSEAKPAEIFPFDKSQEAKYTSPKAGEANVTVPSEIQTPGGALMDEKPKKKGSDRKNKKAENGFSKQAAVLDTKAQMTELPDVLKTVDKIEGTDSSAKSMQVGVSTSEELLKATTDTTKELVLPLVEEKPKDIAAENRKADTHFSEQPCLWETKTDGVKLPAPPLPADKATGAYVTDKSKETGFMALEPQAVTDPSIAVVMDKPKKKSGEGRSKKVKSSSELPGLLEATDTSKLTAVVETDGKTKDSSFIERGKETAEHLLEKITYPSAPKAADKPKKRTGDGKSKKVEKTYFQQPIFLEAKADPSGLSAVVETDDKTKEISVDNKSKGSGLTTGEHLLEGSTDATQVQGPTTLVTETWQEGIAGKGDLSLSEQTFVLEAKTDAARFPASAERVGKTKGVSMTEKNKDSECSALEQPPVTGSSVTPVMDKPRKRGSDGRRKKSEKSAFEQALPLETKVEAHNLPAVVQTAEKPKDTAFADRGKEPDSSTAECWLGSLTDTAEVHVPIAEPVQEKPKIQGSDGKSLCENLGPSDPKMDTAKPELVIKSKEPLPIEKGKELDFAMLEPLVEDRTDVAKAHAPIPEAMTEKPKKKAVGVKSKKVESRPEPHAALEAKMDQSKSPGMAEKVDETKGPCAAGKEVDFAALESLLEDLTDTAKVQAPVMPLEAEKTELDGKGKSAKAEVGLEQPFFLQPRAGAAGLPGSGTEIGDKMTEGTCPEKKKGVGFTLFEYPAVADPSPGLVPDKPKKRGSEGKNKKVKSVSDWPVVEAKTDKRQVQPPLVAELEYSMEEMGFVDENRNIRNFPPGHRMLWDHKVDLFAPFAQAGAAGFGQTSKVCSDQNQGLESTLPEHPAKDGRGQVLPLPEVALEDTGRESRTRDKKGKHKQKPYEHPVKLESRGAGIEASSSGMEGDKAKETAAEDKLTGKQPSPDCKGIRDAKVGRDDVHVPTLAEKDDKEIGFADKRQSECTSLEHVVQEADPKNETVLPGAKVTDKAGETGFVAEKGVGSVAPERPMLWENKAEAVALQVLAAALVENKAEGTGLSEPSLLESSRGSGNEAEVADAAGRGAPTEDISPVDAAKGHCEPSREDGAAELEAGLKDVRALKPEKDKQADLMQKKVAGSGQKVVKEKKKEEKVKAAEQIKGYMRPTKSRGLPAPPPRPAVQDREKQRQLKSNGMNRQRHERAKPEEIKPVETVTGSDITAPPNKELPPSPEKKTKPSASTPSAKPAAEKAKPLSATSPKRPASTTPGQNKKSTSPTTGPAAATPKRPATGTPRPSTLTAKETKPKVAEAKSTEKRTSLSKSASATTPRTSVKSSPAAPRTTAASPVTTTSSMKNTSASPPKRPTSIKTETKPADAKKTPVKSPSADLSRPRSAPGNSLKSSTTTSTATTPTTTMTSPGVATSRPKPKPAATRPTTASSANADAKKPLAAKAPLKTSTTSKPSRPTSSVSAPDLKNVRSKIGSTDNIKHQPGGGKGKVEKKPESAGAARKPESNAVSKMATTKTTVTKESAQKQPNGKVQIVSKKANYSHVQSKCGSKDNIKHVPGGGNVQIQTKKVDLSKVSSKCGSKTNIKHKPGGGDIKTENQKLNFKEKPQGKVGSVDSAGQTPTEGPVKTEESKEAALPAVAPLDGAAAVPQAGGITQENGVGPAVPAAAGGGDQRDSQSFDTQIQETN